MKIALIKQKTGYDLQLNREQYKEKILEILEKTRANILVGPELSISNGTKPINYTELDQFCEDITKNINPNELIIPGTGLIIYRYDNSLRNVAPVLMKNKQYFFNKKSSVNEEEIAKFYNYEYKTGCDDEGIFPCNDQIIAVEICRDHGHGKLRYSTDIRVDLELILACGINSIYPEKTVVKEGGVVAICDGDYQGNPDAFAYKMEKGNLSLLKGKETQDYLLIENE